MYNLNYPFKCIKYTIPLKMLKHFIYIRKRVDLNHQVLNTIFSKYLALPIATFPFLLINLKFLIVMIFYSNNFNYWIEVEYGIKIKFIIDVNQCIQKLTVKFKNEWFKLFIKKLKDESDRAWTDIYFRDKKVLYH